MTAANDVPPEAGQACYYCARDFSSADELGRHLLSDHLSQTTGSNGHASADTDPLGAYRREIVRFPLLSKEEERTLGRKIQAGGRGAKEARRTMIESNLRLVLSIARQYENHGLSIVDLVQEGNIGLLRAVEKFKPELGFRFSTYATWWIKQSIRYGLSTSARTVRVPNHILDLSAKAKKLMHADPEIAGIAQQLEIDQEKVGRVLQKAGARSMSLDAVFPGSPTGECLGDTLEAREEWRAELDPAELIRVLSPLNPKERHVLARRFGLDGLKPAQLEVVAKELGISRERVRQIQMEAIKRLRKCSTGVDSEGEQEIVFDTRKRRRGYRRFRRRERRLVETPQVLPPRKTPQPHQEEALAAALGEFSEHDRATAVMACGTGKTLVGLALAERLGSKSSLVLAPSLGLIRQTLLEWRCHGIADRYLSVCHDETVRNSDALGFTAEDLGVPVSTEPGEIRRRLSEPGRVAVFATYHSARALGAGLPEGFRFDLGIFDEAHRTAGAREKAFSFGLADSEIPIRKRLFMTATPKGVVSDGLEKTFFSMADPAVYGRHVYTLSLSRAIERGIISDYRVVIAVVTQEDVAEALRGQNWVRVMESVMSAKDAAYAIAFARAVQECGVNRVITFHGTVREAEEFSESGWVRRSLLPPGFEMYHANGLMPTAERQEALSRFSAAKAAVVTNSRCLSEGVDLPAVDMVAFMSPRKSRVDIIQMIGRALRKSPGKALGYVMLPIMVDREGNPLSNSDEYRDLSEVIWSLRSQDEVLERGARRRSFVKGAGGGPASDVLDKVEISGLDLLPEKMRQAITVKVLSPLGSSWDEMFGRLCAYRKARGTCVVDSRDGDLQLSNWVIAQRKNRRRKLLSDRQLSLLDSVGFVWNVDREYWERRYRELKEFKLQNGHPNASAYGHGSLGMWVNHQREARKKGRLDRDQIAKLDELGIVWAFRQKRIKQKKGSTAYKPVGTIVIRRGIDNGREVEERWIKVRDDGPSPKRWLPYARWWWEKNKGSVPAGMGVIHKNGNRMDDSPENLMVGGPGDRMRLAHQNNPEMSKRNRKSCHEGCANWNRKQGKLNRLKNVLPRYFYPVLEDRRVVINCPFRRRRTLLAHFGVDVSKIPDSGHGPELELAIKRSPVMPVKGAQLRRDYVRVDPELGVANPEASSGWEQAILELERTPLWEMARRAAALDLADRK